MTNENTENHSIPVRLTDILHFKSLSNLSLSLDGTRAAFMIHQCNGAQASGGSPEVVPCPDAEAVGPS